MALTNEPIVNEYFETLEELDEVLAERAVSSPTTPIRSKHTPSSNGIIIRKRCKLLNIWRSVHAESVDHGQCGACTVLIDDRRVNSCLTLAVMKDGASITTIEGLADGDALHPMQDAFIEHDAFQCGYCTPGQICSAVGLMKEGRAHSPDEIRELMSGNLCRCGCYVNIVAAIEQVLGSGDARLKEAAE